MMCTRDVHLIMRGVTVWEVKWDMSSHENISEECIGVKQVSHQKYSCTNYDVIKYLYSINTI